MAKMKLFYVGPSLLIQIAQVVKIFKIVFKITNQNLTKNSNLEKFKMAIGK